MNGNVNTFERILERFRFKEPVPEEVQVSVSAYSKESLKGILTQFGQYSLWYGGVLKVFYNLKKIGIKMSIAQSKFIFAVVLTISFSTMGSGIVYIVNVISDDYIKNQFIEIIKKFDTKEREIIKEPDEESDENNEGMDKKNIHRDKKEGSSGIEKKNDMKYSLGVANFESSAFKSSEMNNYANLITTELKKRIGDNKVVYTGNANRKNVNSMLIGTINKLGENYFITARVVNVKTSQVNISVVEKVESIDDINGACVKVAERIASKID